MRSNHDHNIKSLSKEIGEKEKLKIETRRKKSSVWSGLGLFGMIGWSVAIPALAGTAIGIWLDKKHPGSHPWTLSGLLAGLMIGCLIAWNWVTKEHKEMNKKEEVQDE